MEIPDQVVDELRGEASATRWLLICIYRYGRPVVDHETGGRRVYLKASRRWQDQRRFIADRTRHERTSAHRRDSADIAAGLRRLEVRGSA